MEYTTLSVEERLSLARDSLRGIEADHYRITIRPGSSGSATQRDASLERFERDHALVLAEVKKLEAEVPTKPDDEAKTAKVATLPGLDENRPGDLKKK